ncbi:unnamed protein product [Caenorhabditis bovis]|uniref:BBSome complex member BBS5 PH domain-containing protein n=1 Tax=Caenorhabditis bovis TaxID=2654633 RepID=A0A8S1EFA2_9PELO|nr:unnamed protein product [Caenorhabditis bovis]
MELQEAISKSIRIAKKMYIDTVEQSHDRDNTKKKRGALLEQVRCLVRAKNLKSLDSCNLNILNMFPTCNKPTNNNFVMVHNTDRLDPGYLNCFYCNSKYHLSINCHHVIYQCERLHIFRILGKCWRCYQARGHEGPCVRRKNCYICGGEHLAMTHGNPNVAGSECTGEFYDIEIDSHAIRPDPFAAYFDGYSGSEEQKPPVVSTELGLAIEPLREGFTISDLWAIHIEQ